MRQYQGFLWVVAALCLNVYTLQAVLSPDGEFSSRSLRVCIHVFDIFLIIIGLLLLKNKSNLSLKPTTPYSHTLTLSKTQTLFLMGAVLIVFCISVELLVRIILPTRPNLDFSSQDLISDPILNHRWKRHLYRVDDQRGPAFLMYANAQSFVEAYEVKKNKPPRTYRIFYIGDSNTQGVTMPEFKAAKIVEQKLEAMLAPKGYSVEVINTGTSSYSTMIYYLMVKYVIQDYAPDLVVINFDMTDVANDYAYRQTALFDENGHPYAALPMDSSEHIILTPYGFERESYLKRAARFLRQHSYAVSVIQDVAKEHHKSKQYQQGIRRPAGDVSANWLAHEWNESILHNVDFSMSLLTQTLDLLESRGIPAMVTGVPHYPQYTHEWSDKPHTVLEHTLRTHKHAYFLNSYQALKPFVDNTDPDVYYFKKDVTHLNTEGNKIWADAQFEFIKQHLNELLPAISNHQDKHTKETQKVNQ